MQTIAFEGRAVVLSANQCMTKKNLPKWILDPPKGAEPAKPAANGSHKTRSSLKDGVPKSIKTEESHENKLLAFNTKSENGTSTSDSAAPWAAEATENAISESGELQQKKTSSERRASSIAKTFENHEVVLPTAEDAASQDQSTDNPHGKGEFVSRGGSCIVDPIQSTLAGPLWEVEDGGILTADVDFEDCERGRLDLDVAGSYSRNDAFKLTVQGLDINPPP